MKLYVLDLASIRFLAVNPCRGIGSLLFPNFIKLSVNL